MSRYPFRSEYPEYKTIRQWALQGLIPVDNAIGIECWVNRNCQKHCIYYSPCEVRKASVEELNDFFKSEIDRNRKLARARREKKQKILKAELEKKQNLYVAAECKNKNKCIFIDTETTGLNSKADELLQVSIIDYDGTVLFNSYIKPTNHTEWREAENINHITPEMVENAPEIEKVMPKINLVVRQAETIIGYNTHFDLDFLCNNGLILSNDVEIIDVMKMFASIYGEWNDYYGDYKWQKLAVCAECYGYDWSNSTAHNSLADCYATLYVFKKIME